MFGPKKHQTNESGFTLIEVLVVLGLIAVLFAIGSINLGSVNTSASVSSVTNTLLADLRNQQILSMTGDKGSSTAQQEHGIYFQSNSYVLFAGSTYSGSDPSDFSISTDPVTLTTTLPGDQVVFAKGNGAVDGFSGSNNTITISSNGESNTISINPYGVTTEN